MKTETKKLFSRSHQLARRRSNQDTCKTWLLMPSVRPAVMPILGKWCSFFFRTLRVRSFVSVRISDDFPALGEPQTTTFPLETEAPAVAAAAVIMACLTFFTSFAWTFSAPACFLTCMCACMHADAVQKMSKDTYRPPHAAI